MMKKIFYKKKYEKINFKVKLLKLIINIFVFIYI